MALCLPRDAETVGVVRAVAVTALERIGVTRDCVDEIRLALSEACTNVIDHARHGDEYEVRLEFDPECCTISVVDTGQGFHPMDIEHAMPPPSADGGRGLAIMQALADRLDLASDASAGKGVLAIVTGGNICVGVDCGEAKSTRA